MGFSEIKNKALHLLAEAIIIKDESDIETAIQRALICGGCNRNNREENKPYGVCMDCGCFLDLKPKSKTNWNPKKNRNEITHCPLGKWNDKETANFYREIDGKELLN